MSKELVLGLDLDGVVFDYVTAARSYFSRFLSVPESEFHDPQHWSFVQSGWPLKSENHYVELHSAAVTAGMFTNMPLIEGASENLWRLSDAGVYIRVVTHRLIANGTHARSAGDTITALDNASIPYRDLTFVGDKPAVGADVYIDDAPHNVENLRNAGNYVIVFDQPYNRHIDGPRARNWKEAYKLVRDYAQKNGFAFEAVAPIIGGPRPIPVPAGL